MNKFSELRTKLKMRNLEPTTGILLLTTYTNFRTYDQHDID